MGRKQSRRHKNKQIIQGVASQSMEFASTPSNLTPQPQLSTETSFESALKAVYHHSLKQIPGILSALGTVQSIYSKYSSTSSSQDSLESEYAECIYKESLKWYNEELLGITDEHTITKDLLYRLYQCFSLATEEAKSLTIGLLPPTSLQSLHECAFVTYFIDPLLLHNSKELLEFEDGWGLYENFILPKKSAEQLKLEKMSIDDLVSFINGRTVKRKKQKLNRESREVELEIEGFRMKLAACEPEMNRLQPMISQKYLGQLRQDLSTT